MTSSPLSGRRARRLSIAFLAAMIVVLPTAIALASTDPSEDGIAGAPVAAPETTIDSGPSGLTADPSPSFAFSSPEGELQFACRLDTSAFEPCRSPQTLGDLPDGRHAFYVRAGDGAGRHDPTPASSTFVVDTVAPEASIDSGPSGPTNDPRPTFTFSSPDASAAFACSLDGVSPAFAACSGAGTDQPIADLPDGSYTFSVEATDPAGNTTTAARDFSVDTRAPAVTVESGPLEATDDPRPTFAFASPDDSATFACSIDAGEPGFGPCTGDRTDRPAADLEAGSHTFRVEATDPAGNSAVATRSFELRETGSQGESFAKYKRSAPKPVPAWYMTARGRRDLRRQARSDACAFARRQSNRTRVLLLDFGKADKHHGEFGTRLRTGPHFSNQEILRAMQSAANRYRSRDCYSRGSVRITYGNTNNMSNWLSRPKIRKAGRRQAMMANRLHKYQRRHGRRYRHEGVAVAGDIEPQWNKPRVTKSLVRGATAHKRGGLYFNYGAASRCPPETSTCANNWSMKNLGQVSFGGVKRSLPEIYRAVHVKQWTNVRRRWNNQHRFNHYCFYGTTATPGFPLSNREGWARLRANNRCVQEELVNIREQ